MYRNKFVPKLTNRNNYRMSTLLFLHHLIIPRDNQISPIKARGGEVGVGGCKHILQKGVNPVIFFLCMCNVAENEERSFQGKR